MNVGSRDILVTFRDVFTFDVRRKRQSYTVWPEILAGNLFWWIGGFESNPPIFLPPKFVQSYSLPA